MSIFYLPRACPRTCSAYIASLWKWRTDELFCNVHGKSCKVISMLGRRPARVYPWPLDVSNLFRELVFGVGMSRTRFGVVVSFAFLLLPCFLGAQTPASASPADL